MWLYGNKIEANLKLHQIFSKFFQFFQGPQSRWLATFAPCWEDNYRATDWSKFLYDEQMFNANNILETDTLNMTSRKQAKLKAWSKKEKCNRWNI